MTSVVSAPGDILLHDGPFGVMYEADSKVSQAMDCSTRFKVHLYFTMLLKLTESVQKEKKKKDTYLPNTACSPHPTFNSFLSNTGDICSCWELSDYMNELYPSFPPRPGPCFKAENGQWM